MGQQQDLLPGAPGRDVNVETGREGELRKTANQGEAKPGGGVGLEAHEPRREPRVAHIDERAVGRGEPIGEGMREHAVVRRRGLRTPKGLY